MSDRQANAQPCFIPQRGPGTDVDQIDRFGEDRLHRAWSGIVNEPLDLEVGAQPRFEPTLALPRAIVRHECLGVGNIWEVPDANDSIFRRFCVAEERQRDRKSQQGDSFHRENTIGALPVFVSAREEEGMATEFCQPHLPFANAFAAMKEADRTDA